MGRAPSRLGQALVMTCALAVLLAACGGGGAATATAPPVSAGDTAPPSPSPAAATSTPSASPSPAPAPTPGALPSPFSPTSVTFVSATTGWVLGTTPCGQARCLALVHTDDGGRTWRSVPAPSTPPSGPGAQTSGAREVRFADSATGWVFAPELWVTRDAGAHWSRVALPGVSATATVQALETSAGTVHAAVFDTAVRIVSSPTSHDAWRLSPLSIPFGGGPVPNATLTLQGTSGWLIQNDRTVIGGARLGGGAWTQWTPPCSGMPGSQVAVAAATPTDVFARCLDGTFSGGPLQTRILVSHNAGTSFQQPGRALDGSLAGAFAAAQRGAAFTAAQGTHPRVLATFDGAVAFVPVTLAATAGSVPYIGFASTKQGFLIISDNTGASPQGSLEVTLDGGHTWSTVTFTAAP